MHPEGIYGATIFTRQCLAEVRGRHRSWVLREEDARRIGRQILRENAPEAMPSLRPHLWHNRFPSSQHKEKAVLLQDPPRIARYD